MWTFGGFIVFVILWSAVIFFATFPYKKMGSKAFIKYFIVEIIVGLVLVCVGGFIFAHQWMFLGFVGPFTILVAQTIFSAVFLVNMFIFWVFIGKAEQDERKVGELR